MKKVKLTTLDWGPYIGTKLSNNGYVAEIAKEAFLREGYELEITFHPWARAIKEAAYGNFNGYFPEYYSKDVEKEFIFSNKFKGGPIVLFKKKNNNIKYSTLSDLKNYKIGTVRGYINTIEFDNANYLNKEEVVDDLTNLRKLVGGRIDLFVADKFVGLSLLKNYLPENINDLDFLDPPLEEKFLYICFPKKLQESELIVAKFNSGLEKITKDGTLDKILSKHGF